MLTADKMIFKKIAVLFVILIIFTGFSYYNSKKISEQITGSSSAIFEVHGNEALMFGVIQEDIVQKVNDLVNNYPKVKTIVMVNVPGSLNSAKTIEAGRIVRKNGISTRVLENGYIASGGTVFFCSGVNRTIENGAKVGVHSWKNDFVIDASKLPKNSPYHTIYLEYFEEMGISSDFYWFMIESAPSFDMHYMTDYEIKKYRITTE